ncbi:hypothetical protein EG329_012316 [Mollisiaceae sp. DMI_Dod_QoI]|nr:hypothetical protein EG329_012316 [Helotiales sp. DMI_Dod_QoI]
MSTSIRTAQRMTGSTSSTATMAFTSVHTTTTTTISTHHVSARGMPQEVNALIRELHHSFTDHHPRIVSIYSLINELNAIIAKTKHMDGQNKAISEEARQCKSEEEMDVLLQKTRELNKEREDVDKETTRIVELWNEAMSWVEGEKAMHEMKSHEGWMKGQ